MLNKMNNHLLKHSIRSKSIEDKETYEKIQRHLSDINDKITEEDIRKVKVGVSINDRLPAGKEERELLIKEMINNERTELTDNEYKEGRKISSVWNIREEE